MGKPQFALWDLALWRNMILSLQIQPNIFYLLMDAKKLEIILKGLKMIILVVQTSNINSWKTAGALLSVDVA